ncbi:MAG: leucine-rich repeat protein [Bacteroidaceae bacterium]|nr:leucine-rich repeat protein [Bacteroidaceae bacterium]
MDNVDNSEFLSTKEKFDNIELLDRCGATSLAYKVRLNRQLFFMKKLRPEFLHDEKYRSSFYKEFNTGKIINNPYVVEYVDICDNADGLYILMEYVVGYTLKQKIESELAYFQDENNVWKLLLQLAEALKALHDSNILHLDISPDNIILTQANGTLKLLDLGFCVSNFDDSTPGFKRSYGAPETRLRDIHEIDARTDIYAVGSILKFIEDRRGKKFSNGLQRIKKRCLSVLKQNRYQSADYLIADIHVKEKNKKALKWVLAFFLSLVLLFLMPFFIDAYEFIKDYCAWENGKMPSKFEVNGIYYRITDSDLRTVAITFKGNRSDEYHFEYGDGEIKIPSSVTYSNRTFRVTSIDRNTFDNPETTSILLPEGLETIQDEAFYDCRLTGTIYIPKTLTNIGNMVFEGNTLIDSILVDIDNPVYDSRNNCNAIIETATNTLTTACSTTVIPTDISAIGDYAFMRYQAKTLTIPQNITSIGKYAFYKSAITEIELPKNITYIGANAFEGCKNLRKIQFPPHIKEIGDYTFLMSGLQQVNIHDSISEIGIRAFSQCTSLNVLVIGKGVRSIETYAFEECKQLTTIISRIPASELKPLGYGCFSNINPRCVLYVPKGAKQTYLKTLGWNAFAKIKEMDEI